MKYVNAAVLQFYASTFFSGSDLTLSISLFAYSKGGTRNEKSYKSNSINVIEQWVDEFVFLDSTVVWISKNDATKNMWMSGFRLYDYVYLPEKLKVNVFLEFFLHSAGSLRSKKFPKLFSKKCIFTLQQIAIFLPILEHCCVRQKSTFTQILKLVWLIIMRISLYSWWYMKRRYFWMVPEIRIHIFGLLWSK